MTVIRSAFVRIVALAMLASLVGIALGQDAGAKKDEPKIEFKAPPLKPLAEKLPVAFYKKVPESVDELKAIQDHVARVAERVMPAVVSVRVGAASGSGVIVSKDGYILTAGHVSGKPDRDVVVIFNNGKTAKGKTLGGNHGIDSGLIKITGDGEWPYVEMGDSSELRVDDWCLVIAHHGGYKTGRPAPVRLGRVLKNDEKRATITTDAVLVGGDSGGPLIDMHGRVVGINSRISNSLASNMHVSVNPFRDDWNKIAQGEVWGKLGGGAGGFGQGGGGVYIGVTTEARDDKVVVTEVAPNSPAEKAGFKVEDIIVKFDDRDVPGPLKLAELVRGHKAGDRVVVEIRRGEENLRLKVEIGRRS
jgi:serine protease Do